jgi:hypothetical protein
METARTSETLVDIQLRTPQNIPENSELHTSIFVSHRLYFHYTQASQDVWLIRLLHVQNVKEGKSIIYTSSVPSEPEHNWQYCKNMKLITNLLSCLVQVECQFQTDPLHLFDQNSNPWKINMKFLISWQYLNISPCIMYI